MKIKFLFIVSAFFCLLKLAPAGAQNLNTGNVQSLNVDQINQAKTVIGYSGLSPQQAAAEARKRGASEAQIQQMLKRMEQEASEKKASNDLLQTDIYQGPDKDAFKLHRSRLINFKDESKLTEVKVNMTDDYNYLNINISCNFDKGSVLIELVDPKGEKKGNYSVKTDDSVVIGDKTTTQEHVMGEMAKEFTTPLKGEWIIRATPISATGRVQIEIIQQYAPGGMSRSLR